MFKSIIDNIWGFDFFISYARDDGTNYPQELKRRLDQEGYHVCLDQQEFWGGNDLRTLTRRRVHSSTYLVVVGRIQSLTESYWVHREIDIYCDAQAEKRTVRKPIIINVNNALEAAANLAGSSSKLARRVIDEDWLWLPETLPHPDDDPADDTIGELRKAFHGTRRDSRRMRVFQLLAVLMFLLSATATWQAWEAVRAKDAETVQRRTAVSAETRAYLVLAENNRQQGRLSDQLFWYAQAAERGLPDDPQTHAAASLLASWSSRLRGTLVHDGIVRRASFNSDGQLIRTQSDDAVRIWDSETNSPIRRPILINQLSSTAFSADSKTLIAGSYDNTAQLWNVEDGTPIGQSLKHADSISAVAISPDGQRVLTGSWDNTAQLWEAKTGQPLGEPMFHKDNVTVAMFSPDGQLVVTGDWDGWFGVWNAMTGVPVFEHMHRITRGIDGRVNAIAFSPDRRTMLVGGWQIAFFWDLEMDQQVGQAVNFDGAHVDVVAFSSDGKTALAGGANKVVVASGGNWEHLKELPGHEHVTSAAFHPTLPLILTGDSKNTARLWNSASGKAMGQPLFQDASIYDVSFSPDGNTILTAGPNMVRSWITEALPEPEIELKIVDAGMITAGAFAPDGRVFLAGSAGGELQRFDTKTGDLIGDALEHSDEDLRDVYGGIPPLGSRSIRTIDISPDGRFGLSTLGRTAQLWEMDSGRPRGELLTNTFLTHVEFHPQGKSALTIGNDGTGRIWDLESLEVTGEFKHENGILSSAFSPQGNFIATSAWDKTVRLWDASSGQALGVDLVHDDNVNVVAFNSTGSLLLTASGSRTIQWDIETGSQVLKALEHGSKVVAAAFSPDGGRFVTAAGNATRVWNATTQEQQGAIMKHDEPVVSVAWSPNGRTILTGTGGPLAQPRAYLWDSTTGALWRKGFSTGRSLNEVEFSPSGNQVFTLGGGELWQLEAPACRDVERLILSVEVRVGYAWNRSNGTKRLFTHQEWLERLQRLRNLGGSCDVRSWGDMNSEEQKASMTPMKEFIP